MTEMTSVAMTSSTGSADFDPIALLDSQSISAQPLGGRAALLLGTLLAIQLASVANVSGVAHQNSSIQVMSTAHAELFDDLLEFHQKLADSQQDLPEDAARLLRENLWRLYG
jgi:hypothetical protein